MGKVPEDPPGTLLVYLSGLAVTGYCSFATSHSLAQQALILVPKASFDAR
jgi:hypothetical protein